MLQVFEEHCFDISQKQLVCLYTYITDLCDISNGYSCALYIKINVIIGEKKKLIVAVVVHIFNMKLVELLHYIKESCFILEILILAHS